MKIYDNFIREHSEFIIHTSGTHKLFIMRFLKYLTPVAQITRGKQLLELNFLDESISSSKLRCSLEHC